MTRSEMNVEEIRKYLLILRNLNSLETCAGKRKLYLTQDEQILKCIQKYQNLQRGLRYVDFFPLREADFACPDYIENRIRRQLVYFESLIRLDKRERKRLRLEEERHFNQL